MLSVIDPRFECSICLNCLKEPMLTRCGHRFCSECINAWLKREIKICPIDSLPLSIDGLFPDNYTKREIDEQNITCLNDGCEAVIPLLEADQHFASCEFNKNQLLSKSHIDFKNKLRNGDIVCSKTLEATQLWDANKDPSSQKALLCNLYERIVILEQSNIEKDKDIVRLNQNLVIKDKDIEQLSETINNLIIEFKHTQNAILLLTCNGIYVWRFEHFTEALKLMKDKATRYYTPGFYTSSTGYKVCGRINISTDNRNISLFIHMMPGDYDDTLNWPFSGHITLSLIHPINPMETINLKMQSSAESEAFKRYSFGNTSTEVLPMNPIAFGYADFVTVEEILQKGFIKDDQIVIKIIVECI